MRSQLPLVLTGSYDSSGKIWSALSGDCLQTLAGHGGAVMSAVFSPDGERALTASHDESGKIRSSASVECLHTLTGHRGRRRSGPLRRASACILSQAIAAQ